MILLLKNADWQVLTNDWTAVEKLGRMEISYQGDSDYINVRLTPDQFAKHLRDSSTICDLRGFCE